MPTSRWILPGLLACALLTSACVSFVPRLADAGPPRVEIPAEATRPCDLYRLPGAPNQADLEGGYDVRGAQVLGCDGKRDLAVQAQVLEHQLIDQWLALRAERNRPFWMKLTPWRE